MAEDKTAGGVLLTDSAKEKPVIGTVCMSSRLFCFEMDDLIQVFLQA